MILTGSMEKRDLTVSSLNETALEPEASPSLGNNVRILCYFLFVTLVHVFTFLAGFIYINIYIYILRISPPGARVLRLVLSV